MSDVEGQPEVWLPPRSFRLQTEVWLPPLGGSISRAVWTAGAALSILHTVAAFHYVHAWSHAAAAADTARQTAAAIGVNNAGGGIWFNYVFIAIWAMDAVWWWVDPGSRRIRPAWIDRAIRGFLFFMFFNGAIVFAHGWVRVVGTLSNSAVIGAWLFFRLKPEATVPPEGGSYEPEATLPPEGGSYHLGARSGHE